MRITLDSHPQQGKEGPRREKGDSFKRGPLRCFRQYPLSIELYIYEYRIKRVNQVSFAIGNFIAVS